MDRQRKVAFAMLAGGAGLGGFTFAADKLNWPFPPVLMYALAVGSIVGLLISGAIWVHLAYESYVERWGKSMIAQLALLIFGLFAVAAGGAVAWKGGAKAWNLWKHDAPANNAGPDAPTKAKQHEAKPPATEPVVTNEAEVAASVDTAPVAKQDRKGAGKGAATASSDTRVETKKALRGFYARVGVILQGIANAPTDQSLDNLEQDMYAVQIDTSTWVLKHMGEAANQKLRSGIRPAMGFPWPGEHSAESQLLRNKMMVTLMDMQTNLEAMMQSDTWDKQ